MCKALGERIVTSAGYNCVRYGNVNNSRGSVLPYWKSLKGKNEEIPVTNPQMTRFLIDFKESIKLIELAMKKMDGRIYIPKLDAANVYDMSKLFGKVAIIGERPKEKMHEELINDEEFRGHVEEFDSYFVVHEERKFPFSKRIYSSDTAKQLKGEELRKRLKEFL